VRLAKHTKYRRLTNNSSFCTTIGATSPHRLVE
jgi:hypothetical protein